MTRVWWCTESSEAFQHFLPLSPPAPRALRSCSSFQVFPATWHHHHHHTASPGRRVSWHGDRGHQHPKRNQLQQHQGKEAKARMHFNIKPSPILIWATMAISRQKNKGTHAFHMKPSPILIGATMALTLSLLPCTDSTYRKKRWVRTGVGGIVISVLAFSTTPKGG